MYIYSDVQFMRFYSYLLSNSDTCIVVSTIFCRLDVSYVRGFPYRRRIYWRAWVAVSTPGHDKGRFVVVRVIVDRPTKSAHYPPVQIFLGPERGLHSCIWMRL